MAGVESPQDLLLQVKPWVGGWAGGVGPRVGNWRSFGRTLKVYCRLETRAVLPSSTAPLILVADNDLAVSSLLCEVLRRAGMRVEAAYDGDQAMSSVARPTVAVFICDLDMPRRSGIEVVESLRTHANPPATLVISGYLDEGMTKRLQGLPWVRGLLRKPFDLLAFAAQVQQLAGWDRGVRAAEVVGSPER